MYGGPRPRWPDLPPDLLRQISGRLHHVINYVRFHAVCKAWRNSHDPSAKKPQSFLPWLVAPGTDKDVGPLSLRCIFSKKTYLAPPLPSLSQQCTANWVGGADGASLRYFTALPYPTLHDPLVTATAAPAVMRPSFPNLKGQWPASPSGIVYGDGTILLYKNYYPKRGTAEFKAAILRPGDAAWTVVERTLESPDHGEFSVAYHDGKVLVTEDASLWQVLTPACNDGSRDMLVPRPSKEYEHDEYLYENSYVMESHGELLWVTVTLRLRIRGEDLVSYDNFSFVRALSVLVYALEEAPDKKMRWVRKHGRSLADRVLFLGSPNSFSVDASRLDSSRDGGCAYFMCYNYDERHDRRWCVIRYYLAIDLAMIVEWLPQTWQNDRCAWLVLQPTIAPVQEIRERLLDAPKWKWSPSVAPATPRSLIHVARPSLQPCFRILVCNLPPTVNSSQLRHFFSKHGEVSSTKIFCYKKTKTPQGRGFVTLATSTVHAHQRDAIAALNGLVWDGYGLKVSLVNEKRRRRPSPIQAAQLHIARSTWS